jgi:hypothetical protein
MSKFRKNYNEDSTWQAVYMDLITLLMLFFLILWIKQKGGDGAPVETNKIIPFQKISVGDSSFASGKISLKKVAQNEISNMLSSDVNQQVLKNLGYSQKNDKYYYITVHGHGSLRGNFEQNMNIALGRARSVAEEVKNAYKLNKKSDLVNKDIFKDDRYMISVCGHSYNFPKENIDKNLQGRDLGQQQSVNRRVDIMYHEVPGSLMNSYFLGE